MSKHQNSSYLSQRLPVQIDPIRLAVARQQLQGELEISRLTRLSDLLTLTDGTVKVQLDFDVDVNKVHYARGTIKADLSLCCQRCMQAMPFELELDISLGFIAHEHQIDELVAEYEPYLIETTPVVLTDIIEDEILLALPQVPMHEESQCKPAVPLKEFNSMDDSIESGEQDNQDNQGQTVDEQSTGKRKNPFEVLTSIKSDSKK
jgi:uncharacterized protein